MKYPNSPNFAKKWFEVDLTYPIIKAMENTRIIRLSPAAASSI